MKELNKTDFDENIDFDANQEQTRADLLSYCFKFNYNILLEDKIRSFGSLI
jgi:hypothetical protein